MDEQGVFFQIRFTNATKPQNFPISMSAFRSLPIDVTFNSSHLDLNLFAFLKHSLTSYDAIYDKFRLLIKLFVDYRLNIVKFEPKNMNFLDLQKRNGSRKIMDFSSNKYMKTSIDSAQLELLEHLDSIALDDLKNAIPNIINWSDANIGKNLSGYCAVRNAYQHPNLYEDTKNKLAELFVLHSEFNQDGSINRYSSNNQKNLEESVKPILEEIQIFFKQKYFKNESLPFDKIIIFT